jgi:hypothetical protein
LPLGPNVAQKDYENIENIDENADLFGVFFYLGPCLVHFVIEAYLLMRNLLKYWSETAGKII